MHPFHTLQILGTSLARLWMFTLCFPPHCWVVSHSLSSNSYLTRNGISQCHHHSPHTSVLLSIVLTSPCFTCFPSVLLYKRWTDSAWQAEEWGPASPELPGLQGCGHTETTKGGDTIKYFKEIDKVIQLLLFISMNTPRFTKVVSFQLIKTFLNIKMHTM